MFSGVNPVASTKGGKGLKGLGLKNDEGSERLKIANTSSFFLLTVNNQSPLVEFTFVMTNIN